MYECALDLSVISYLEICSISFYANRGKKLLSIVVVFCMSTEDACWCNFLQIDTGVELSVGEIVTCYAPLGFHEKLSVFNSNASRSHGQRRRNGILCLAWNVKPLAKMKAYKCLRRKYSGKNVKPRKPSIIPFVTENEEIN